MNQSDRLANKDLSYLSERLRLLWRAARAVFSPARPRCDEHLASKQTNITLPKKKISTV